VNIVRKRRDLSREIVVISKNQSRHACRPLREITDVLEDYQLTRIIRRPQFNAEFLGKICGTG
jgi:hypothetical protein